MTKLLNNTKIGIIVALGAIDVIETSDPNNAFTITCYPPARKKGVDFTLIQPVTSARRA